MRGCMRIFIKVYRGEKGIAVQPKGERRGKGPFVKGAGVEWPVT